MDYLQIAGWDKIWELVEGVSFLVAETALMENIFLIVSIDTVEYRYVQKMQL